MDTAVKEHVETATKLYEEWKELRGPVLAAGKTTTEAQVSLDTLTTTLPGVDVTPLQEALEARKEKAKKDMEAYERKTTLLRGLRELTANVIGRLLQVYKTLDLDLDVTVSTDTDRIVTAAAKLTYAETNDHQLHCVLKDEPFEHPGPAGYSGPEWRAIPATPAP